MAKHTDTDLMCQFCLPHKQIKAEILPFLRMNRNSSRDGASIVYKRYVHIRRLASINHMFQLDGIYDTLLFWYKNHVSHPVYVNRTENTTQYIIINLI